MKNAECRKEFPAIRNRSALIVLHSAFCILISLLIEPSAAAQPAGHRYVAAPVATIEYAGPPPMFMPTDVAAGPDGTVFVADGVNDRVLVFDADGRPIGAIAAAGELPLSNPIGLDVDSGGRLWIADNGNRRIVALVLVGADGGASLRQEQNAEFRMQNAEKRFRPHGTVLHSAFVIPHSSFLDLTLAHEFTFPPAADITDVAISADGAYAWFADNNHHGIGRIEIATGERGYFGELGESLGQFRYPFMIAAAADGDVYVSDVINGRVQVFSPAGRAVGMIGAYGVQLGDLYKPKGVAVDGDGHIWIADQMIGVVQIFRSTGALLDVLRDEAGAPLRFDMPTGLALDGRGHVYVVEIKPSRIRKLRVTVDPAVPPVATRGLSRALATAQPKTCTACHMEWMQPLVEGRPTEIAPVPPSTPDEPFVAQSRNCLSCHDGSVADSRRRVWIEHGHRLDEPPPPWMNVADHLPLVDGKIACRTCHSAHARAGSGNELKDAVFLRTDASPSQLCTSCHTGMETGVAGGMHPLGAMPIEVPSVLRKHQALSEGAMSVLPGRAAAPPVEGEGLVSCLSCHNGHGAVFDYLLVHDPQRNDLCLSCHSSLSPELFSDATRSRHGRMPPLDEAQQAVAAGLHTATGAAGELLCRTCHQTHHALPDRSLLAFDPAGGDVCIGCHTDQGMVAGSVHDLRTHPPTGPHGDASVLNRLGQTPLEAGTCGSCHTAHAFARETLPTTLDPGGQCMTCHAEGQLAQAHIGPLNHPAIACGQCHNPHETRFGSFLCGPPGQDCRMCHTEQAMMAGGPHDTLRDRSAWPQAAQQHDSCLACHRPHGDEVHGLFRVALAADAPAADAACIACHTDVNDVSPRTLLHPRSGAERNGEWRMTNHELIPGATDSEFVIRYSQSEIRCATCHDPHLGSAALLRGDPQQGHHDLCLSCHSDRSNVHNIGHAPEMLAEAGFDSHACLPCHTLHGHPQSVEPRNLWPVAMSGDMPAPGGSRTSHYCTGCHRPDGPVVMPAVSSHPEMPMFNPLPPESPAFLPLFNERDEVDPAGFITCRTCHLTHGRSDPLPFPETMPNLPLREMRARQWHIRTFVGDNVCTVCHGQDALRRYIRFHDPQRRGGPLTRTSAPPPAGTR